MSLFEFIKDIGQKMSGDKDLETSLRDAVGQARLGIQDFKLNIKDDTVYLHGQASNAKDLELARLIVGNFKGVEKVNDDGLSLKAPSQTAPAAAPSPATVAASSQVSPYAPAKMVTVQKGDTLSKLAQQYLGEPGRYPEIFEANKPMLKDPDAIFPGQIIRIPTEMMAKSSGQTPRGTAPYA